MTMPGRVPAKLASARAYWRLASKAYRAGQYKMSDHYQRIGDRLHRAYRADLAAAEAAQARQAEIDRRAEVALLERLAEARRQILADEALAAILLDRREAS